MSSPHFGAGLAAILMVLVAGCAAPTRDSHIPPFAKVPYEPFARQSAVAIAIREWRLFGESVALEAESDEAREAESYHPEQIAGLWQRIGEYWWLALYSDQPARARTGKHNERGVPFQPGEDTPYAWSAVFISYVMRIAGAGPGFPYSAAHAEYINEARRASLGLVPTKRLWAERIDAYAPQLGDLICFGRAGSYGMTFDALPTTRHFPSHCDMVVEIEAGRIAVIGGNVSDAVTLKYVAVGEDGKLAGPDGMALDTRFPWFTVLRVLYDR